MAFALRLTPQTYRDLRPYLRRTAPKMAKSHFYPTGNGILRPAMRPAISPCSAAADRTLIAGDAFVTVDVDNAIDFLTLKPEFNRPPAPATPDYESAQESVRRLAELEPLTVACGHGIAMSGPEVPAQLQAFAQQSVMPAHGRYVPTSRRNR